MAGGSDLRIELLPVAGSAADALSLFSPPPPLPLRLHHPPFPSFPLPHQLTTQSISHATLISPVLSFMMTTSCRQQHVPLCMKSRPGDHSDR